MAPLTQPAVSKSWAVRGSRLVAAAGMALHGSISACVLLSCHNMGSRVELAAKLGIEPSIFEPPGADEAVDAVPQRRGRQPRTRGTSQLKSSQVVQA